MSDHTLRCVSRDVMYVMRVNDVIVGGSIDGKGVQVVTSLNRWLRSGDNSIQVDIRQLREVAPDEFESESPWQRDERDRAAWIRPEIDVSIGTESTDQPPQIMYRYLWPNPEQPETELPTETPAARRNMWIDEATLGQYEFERAAQFPQLGRSEQRDVLTAYGEVHAAAQSGDVDRLMSLSQIRNRELARVYEDDPREFDEFIREQFVELTSQPLISQDPHDSDQYSFIPGWNGRLTKLVLHNGMEPLMTQPERDGFARGFEIYFAQIDGTWTWVR